MLEIPKSVTVSECILVQFSGRINIQLAIKIGQPTIKVEEPKLNLEVPRVFAHNTKHIVLRKDVFDVADSSVDLAYYDPPYGSNNEKMPPSRVRYASYYHPWTTICLNDKPPLFGKANTRIDSSDRLVGSIFEEFRRNPSTDKYIAVEAIERLIKKTRAKWVLLSYSSSGRSTAEELHEILTNHGELIKVRRIDHRKNVMAEMKWTHEWISESQKKTSRISVLG